MISCILGGNYTLQLIGREVAIIIGLVLIFAQQLGLYWLSAVNDPYWFVFWSFVAQLVGGLGSGTNSVASMAMVVSGSKESEREQNIGLIEMATGIGFLLGPIWGSVMYQWGGYSAPFGSTALFYALSYPYCVVVLKQARDHRLAREAQESQLIGQSDNRDSEKVAETDKTQHDEIDLMYLLGIVRFFFGLVSQVLVSSSI